MANKQINAKTTLKFKNAIYLISFLFVVWGFYRFLFKLPDEVEELVIKPVIWLVPVFVLLRRERAGLSSIGFTTKNLFPSIYFAVGLGVVFGAVAMVINYLKYGGFDFSANVGTMSLLASIGLSFATAFTEELTFRGYIFTRIWGALGNELSANLTTSFLWALVHLPITIFVWKLNFAAGVTYLLITTIFGIGSAFLFAKTKNIFSSIFLHVLWSWPIILFR